MTDAPKLKPCPFCGSGPAITVQNALFSGVELLDYRGMWFANCGTCGTEGAKTALKDDAVKAWNTRADLTPAQIMADPRVNALVEALREANTLLGSIPALKNNQRVSDAIHASRAALSDLAALEKP